VTLPEPPPLLWLSRADVAEALPSLEERLHLAELTLTALAQPGAAQLPPKMGVHPGPAGSFSDAMPAWLRGQQQDGADSLLGIKWVTVFPTNSPLGLPPIHAAVILNDAQTGLPIALLDGGPITAHRTAAVTGVVLRHFAPRIAGRPARVALIGAGAQGRSHLPVVGSVMPGASLAIHDRHPDRTEVLARLARDTPGLGSVQATTSARQAVEGADVVVTAASFGPIRQVMNNDWLAETVTVVPVDYATYCAAEVVRDASLFLIDERGQFEAKRAAHFDGYRDPDSTIGEAILAATPRPPGRVVATHLGVGLADLVFGDAIVRAARRLGLGTPLPR
jgi:ornithine cyclodeaminase/alanine dehydrogenase-like protein (mu-crystallin family)